MHFYAMRSLCSTYEPFQDWKIARVAFIPCAEWVLGISALWHLSERQKLSVKTINTFETLKQSEEPTWDA